MEALERLRGYLKERPLGMRKLKEEGTKVVGCSAGGFAPEELIYAAGAVPVQVIRGGEAEPLEASTPYAIRWMCPFVRAQVGYMALGEEPYHQMMDLFVSVVSCQQLRRLGDIWGFFFGVKTFKLGLPHDTAKDYNLRYFVSSLKEMKAALENLTGNEISDAKLKKAVTLYNRMRELLSNISLLRKSQPPGISARDFIEINHASFVVDPAFMVDTLESLYRDLKKQQGGYQNQDAPRVLLTGPNLAIGDYKVVDLIAEAGGAIVAEEICEGMRHYGDKVEDNGDLLEALGRRYFTSRLPGAFQMPSMRRRFKFLENLAREYAVDGIVWYQLKNCETYDLEAFYLDQKLNEAGIPMLKLESEYQAQEIEGFRTRIEAFLETIRRK